MPNRQQESFANPGSPTPIRLRPTTPSPPVGERNPVKLEKILTSHFYRPTTPLSRPTESISTKPSPTPAPPINNINNQVDITFAERSPKLTLNKSAELVIIDGDDFIGTSNTAHNANSTPPPPKISRQSALTTAQIAVMSPEPAVPADGPSEGSFQKIQLLPTLDAQDVAGANTNVGLKDYVTIRLPTANDISQTTERNINNHKERSTVQTRIKGNLKGSMRVQNILPEANSNKRIITNNNNGLWLLEEKINDSKESSIGKREFIPKSKKVNVREKSSNGHLNSDKDNTGRTQKIVSKFTDFVILVFI